VSNSAIRAESPQPTWTCKPTSAFPITGGFAALTARASNAADPDFYQAIVYWTGTQFNADIFLHVGGGPSRSFATFNLGSRGRRHGSCCASLLLAAS